MRIREATQADAHAIAIVNVEIWRTAYRGIVPQAYLDALSVEAWEGWAQTNASPVRPQASCRYVAESETGEIVGFARGGPRRMGDPAFAGELYAIYLLEAFQGQGIGRALARAVAACLAQHGMPSMLVWALEENWPARRFYERLGGQLLPERERIEIGGKPLVEVAYGWRDTRALGA